MKTYEALTKHYREVNSINETLSLLTWDEQVNLPFEAASQRAESLEVLSGIKHKKFTEEKVGEWLNECLQNTAELSSDEQVNLKEMKRTYDRAVKIPAKFVAKKAKLSSGSSVCWLFGCL